MDKKTRTYEEIITLQDKAIEALTQANAALVMALEALKKARAEHGFRTLLPGLAGHGLAGHGQTFPQTFTTPLVNPVYIPNTANGTNEIQWSGGTNTAGNQMASQMAAKTVSVNSIISQAHSQTDMAKAYITAFQGYQKEYDAQVGQHVSLCQNSDE